MEPSAKKLRVDEPSGFTEMTFLELNDDCLRYILWKLSPADLCSMSFTCKRMQELSYDHFSRQNRDEAVTIAMDEFRNPYLLTVKTKNHLKYFSKCIKNVRITASRATDDLKCLFDFVNAECNAKLRTLKINIAGRLKADHIDMMKSRLENLSSFAIHQPNSGLEIHFDLLKYCKKLENLEIQTYCSSNISWMLHEYPTIKSLCIELDVNAQKTQFELFAKKFFQLNPQIKNIQCSEFEVMKAVLLNVNNIERLILRFYGWSEFLVIIEYLKAYNKKGPIKCLELTMPPDITTEEEYNELSNELINLNSFQPIHCLRIFLNGLINETSLSQLKTVVHLEIFVQNEFFDENKLLSVLSKELPELQYLELNLIRENLSFKDVVMEFIRNSFFMKKLTIKCNRNTFTFQPNDMIELHQARSAVSSACPILIRLDYFSDYEVFVKPQFTQIPKSVVSLKFTALDGNLEL